MDFGMPTLIENNSLRENVDLCVSLGLKFVELNLNLPEYQVDVLEKDDELHRYCADAPVYFTIHLDENLNIADFNNAVSNAYLDTVKRTVDVAAALGIPVLNMHMNRGVHFTLPSCKVYLFEKYKEKYTQAYATFRNVCEAAIGSSDLKICIENTDGWADFEKSTVEYLLKSKVFALTFDIGHSHSVGDKDEPFITAHKDKLRHFHIHDALGKSNHLTLGTGEIDLQSRLGLAEACGCRCVVETKTIDALKASADWLKAQWRM